MTQTNDRGNHAIPSPDYGANAHFPEIPDVDDLEGLHPQIHKDFARNKREF
jgi:hypothetical protein